MIGAEMLQCDAAMNGRVEDPTAVGTIDRAGCTPTPTRRRVNWCMTTRTQ